MTKISHSAFTSSTNHGKDFKRYYRPIAAVAIIGLLLISLFITSSFLQKAADPNNSTSSITQDQLFDLKKINEVHLHFKDSAWQKMEPYGGPFGVKGVGKGWLDLAMILGAPYYYGADQNNDQIITHKEFISLAETWFKDWRTEGDSTLNGEMIDAGFSSLGMDLRSPRGVQNGIGGQFGIRFPEAKADLAFNDQIFPKVTVRYKGNGTILNVKGLKRSIKIDLNDGFPSRNLAGATKITLHNLVEDAGYMTDVLAYQLFRDAKVPASLTSYAKVYFSADDTLNNQYLGLYLLLENVDAHFVQHWFGTKKGALFKPVTPRIFEYMGDTWDNYIQTYDPKTPLSIQETNRIIEVCKFVSTASNEEFSLKVGKYFDLDNLARYLAVDVLISDIDGMLGPGQNMYMYLHPKTLQLSFIPWDHDQSFGTMVRGTQEQRDNLSIKKPWLMKNSFLEKLFKDEQFHLLYFNYLKEFNETLFKPERLIGQVKVITPIVREAIKEESAYRLNKFDYAVGLTNEFKDTVKNPQESANPLRKNVVARHTSVADQLSGKSTGIEMKNAFPPGIIVSIYMPKLDVNKDSVITHKEFIQAFEKWFKDWAGKSGKLTLDKLLAGVSKDISPFGPDPTKMVKPEQAKKEKTDSVKNVK